MNGSIFCFPKLFVGLRLTAKICSILKSRWAGLSCCVGSRRAMPPTPGVSVGDGVSFIDLNGKRAAGKVQSILASRDGSKLYILKNDGSRVWVDLASFKEASEDPLAPKPGANPPSPPAGKRIWPPPASKVTSGVSERSPPPKPSLIEEVLANAAPLEVYILQHTLSFF